MSRLLSFAFALTSIAVVSAAPTANIVDGKIVITGLDFTKLYVVVAEGSEADIAARPAMVGDWSDDKHGGTFTPKFPLKPGIKYRIVSDTEKLEVSIPRPKPGMLPRVDTVLPTAADLPENILRFYVQFSASMPRGDAYKYVEVFKKDGTKVEQPFLELDNELWNEDQTRLTLLIDPGRIKKEVKPRLDLGPVFMDQGNYTLVVSGKWPTSDGRTLGKDFSKPIRVKPAISEGIDPKTWKLSSPVKLNDAVRIAFGRPIDHPLMMRCLTVIDSNGREVAGRGEEMLVGSGWSYFPKEPWKPGEYRVHVDSLIEDVCGNRIGQPFEIDLLKPMSKEKPKDMELAFTVPNR